MSAPETQAPGAARGPPVRLAACELRITEASDFSRGATLRSAAESHGVALPPPGRVLVTGAPPALCVRPGRWLLLEPPGGAAGAGPPWLDAAAAQVALVDLSSALAAFVLSGAGAPGVLSRGCRLDLDPARFAAGSAAATIVAQVSVVLAALPAGILLLTPASTARHFRDWLIGAARAFELRELAAMPVTELFGVRSL